jgi:hypothetical protein
MAHANSGAVREACAINGLARYEARAAVASERAAYLLGNQWPLATMATTQYAAAKR